MLECLLGPTRVQIPNGISIGSAVFAQLSRVSPYVKMGSPFTHKNCLFSWGIWTAIDYSGLHPSPPSCVWVVNGHM